jgi:tetratricopeptide (TPR) repeat protein
LQNNETTIEHCLESIKPLNANILVSDIGCKDKSIEICREFGAEFIKLSLNNDFSQVRNKMIEKSKTVWNFYIEPWESIISGHDIFLQIVKTMPKIYKVNILQGDILTKQTRIWHKDCEVKFKNPVFETILGPADIMPIYISAFENQRSNKELIENWIEKNPLDNDPVYYKACNYLTEKNWDTYLNFAGLYLHQEKSDSITVYMTHYYCSMVNCYIKKNYQQAIKHLVPCLMKNPTLAEFWCLLGDCYYSFKDYDRAKCFYENALLLGSRRLKNDEWFMEISKYQEYPDKMIQACQKIKDSSKSYKQVQKTQVSELYSGEE